MALEIHKDSKRTAERWQEMMGDTQEESQPKQFQLHSSGWGGGEIPYQKKRWQSCDKTESYPQAKVLTSLQSGHGLLVRPWLLWRTDQQWKGTPILSLSILRRQWSGAMHGNLLCKTETPLRARNRNNHNSGSLNLIPPQFPSERWYRCWQAEADERFCSDNQVHRERWPHPWGPGVNVIN